MTLLAFTGWHGRTEDFKFTDSVFLTDANARTQSSFGVSSFLVDLPAAQEDDGMTVGMGIWPVLPGSGINNALIFSGDNAATPHITIDIDGSGRLVVRRGAGGIGTIILTTDPYLAFTGWKYLEVSLKIDDAAGFVTLKLDENTVGSVSGVDTRNGGADALIDRLACLPAPANLRWSDFYLLSEAGSAPYNTFLGDCRVWELFPNGAGNYTQLTPIGSGTNWQNVDDNPPSMTDRNEHATVGNKDTYTMDNLTPPVGTVYAIQSVLFASKSDSGAKSIRPVFRRAGVDGTGADQVLSTSEDALWEIFITDPTDASALTITKVNDMELGAEVRA